MKWWGWGNEGVAFEHADKPGLAPFLYDNIGIDLNGPPALPVRFEDLDVPAASLSQELRGGLEQAVGAEHVSTEPLDRVVHARGKSLRDIYRQRTGDIGRVPDAVVRPGDEAQVQALLRAALDADAVIIPFGGGTSISGSLEPSPWESRAIVSVDLGRMGRVLGIDPTSRLARVQAGVLGPDLDRQLADQGWTLGHYPDSFSHSTLGGWIATRSSGMQSDKYGDMADLTRAVRVITPTGVLATRPVPSASTGPSIREMVLGSEGRLGIITEATVQVHRIPEKRKILGYLFPSWSDGLAAMQELAASEASTSVTRISDANETRFSFATRKEASRLDQVKSRALTTFLERRRGFDPQTMCLAFVGFEGTSSFVAAQRKAVGRIVSRHRGLCVGAGPGVLYDQKKFDTPYIRDVLLEHGALGDVSETAAPWSLLPTVYSDATAAAQHAFAELGVRGWVMCHLSHSYHGGACLYFTFAFKPSGRRPPLEEYDVIKSAVQQAFVDSGATLSHHHAVGLEHRAWLEQDVSAPGVGLLRSLFEGVDPGGNLNPGKIV